MQTWIVFYLEGTKEGFAPHLVIAMPSAIEAPDAHTAAERCARAHSFSGIRQYVCVPKESIEEVSLMRDAAYKKVDKRGHFESYK